MPPAWIAPHRIDEAGSVTIRSGPHCGSRLYSFMSMRILIVDDNEATARHLRSVLQALGHEVVAHAKNGASAVRIVNDHTPELVFLDLVMPEMDGLAALRVIRQVAPQVKVIVLSSLRLKNQIDEAMRLGANGYSFKPFELADIREAIAALEAPAQSDPPPAK